MVGLNLTSRGSFGNPGPAGFGCIIRDFQGDIYYIRCGPIGYEDSTKVEVMGLIQGLRLIKDKGINNCIIEGDSATMVSWARGHARGPWKLNHLVREFRDFVSLLQVDIYQVPRSQNCLADRRAKWGVDQEEIFHGNSILESLDPL